MAVPTRRTETQHRPMQRWEPFRELEELQERTLQRLDRAWTGDGEAGVWAPLADRSPSRRGLAASR